MSEIVNAIELPTITWETSGSQVNNAAGTKIEVKGKTLADVHAHFVDVLLRLNYLVDKPIEGGESHAEK